MKKLPFAIAFTSIAMLSATALADGVGSATLYAGDYLFRGQRVIAESCYYQLDMQGDGNLVMYGGGSAWWATGTNNGDGFYATVQGDGNFVVYAQGNRALWAANTANGTDPGTVQVWVQDDGNVVDYRWTPNRQVTWASNTVGETLGTNPCEAESNITRIVDGINYVGDQYAEGTTSDPMQCGTWCAANAAAPAGVTCNAFHVGAQRRLLVEERHPGRAVPDWCGLGVHPPSVMARRWLERSRLERRAGGGSDRA